MPSPVDAAIRLIGQARRASEGRAPASVPAGLPEPEPPGLRRRQGAVLAACS